MLNRRLELAIRVSNWISTCRSCITCQCPYIQSTVSVYRQYLPRDWLVATSPEWPELCQLRRKTLTQYQSSNLSIFSQLPMKTVGVAWTSPGGVVVLFRRPLAIACKAPVVGRKAHGERSRRAWAYNGWSGAEPSVMGRAIAWSMGRLGN